MSTNNIFPTPTFIIGKGSIGKTSPNAIKIEAGNTTKIFANRKKLGKMVDMEVVVIDPNPVLDSKPDVLVNSMNNPVGEFRFSADDYIVILTKGASDIDALEASSKSGARYIGMLASRKRIKADFEIIEAKGVSRQFMESIHAPIGVDIGSVTPEEIALSIIAQIISVRRAHQPAS